MAYHWVCTISNTTVPHVNPFHSIRVHSPPINVVLAARSLVFCVVFCRLWFVLLSYLFWLLYCLPFFTVRLLITSLLSSNLSSEITFIRYVHCQLIGKSNILKKFGNKKIIEHKQDSQNRA